MSERWRSTYVEVHLPHLVHNFKLLKSCVAESALFCPMVKADAYGHGDIEVAQAIERHGPITFGVALVEEGVKLRRAGIQSQILVFGTFDHDGAEASVNFNLIPVLSTWDHIGAFERALGEGDHAPVHIKFNTGMSRLGFEPQEAPKLAAHFKGQGRMRLGGVATHLLNGGDYGVGAGSSEKQEKLFSEIFSHFKDTSAVGHYLNSSAILTRPNTKMGARPGIALYGAMPPTSDQIRAHLLPVMSWKSALGLVRKVPKGATVSYDGTWTAKRESWIGLVPVGYADGYGRAFNNKGVMLFRGKRCPVAGIVCMDYTLLDLTGAVADGEPKAGEEIVILGKQGGEQLKVEELASMTGTISYEIMTRLGARVPMLIGSVGLVLGLLLPAVFPVLPALLVSAALFGLSYIFYHVAVQNLVGTISREADRARNFN
ncbi:MAG: alanine racemase, partial [Bdellovibrionia bacterium]